MQIFGMRTMTTFNWSPGIGDPTLIGWLTVVLYFLAALDCWLTARMLNGRAAKTAKEIYAWRAIAIAFLALGMNKQLDLQTALTEAGRVLATLQGWYDQRQSVQVTFITVVAILSLIAAVVLVRWARDAPVSTWLALAGSVMVICYVLIRAASFHHIDHFIGAEVLGLRWNWILEIGGISAVLAASYWRRRAGFLRSSGHSIRATRPRGRRLYDLKIVDDELPQGYKFPDYNTPVHPTHEKQSTAQIWLTYSELSELLRCELSEVRQAVTDNEWSERRSSDGRLWAKLSPALAHQFMLNYAAGFGRELMGVRVDAHHSNLAAGGKCQVAAGSLLQSASIYPRAERRANLRQQITTEALIRIERFSVVCTVQDFSPAGVGLTLPETVTLPAEFDLSLGGATHHCLTVWRHLDRMGAKSSRLAIR
jgi:hypothetical protein